MSFSVAASVGVQVTRAGQFAAKSWQQDPVSLGSLVEVRRRVA